MVGLSKADTPMSSQQDYPVWYRANLENERRLLLSRNRWIETHLGIVSEEEQLRAEIRKLKAELTKYS